MSRKTLFLASAIALVAAFVAAVLFYNSDKLQRWTGVIASNQAALASLHSPTLGSPGAKVHIVEFMDPACETCAQFYPYVKRLMAINADRIRLSIRHTPLHSNVLDVVRMLEASRKQDRYWQALEALLNRQSQWVINHVADPDRALPVFESAGLDISRLKVDMNAPDVLANIERDRADAQALNVRATPEYFVNGRGLPDFGLEQLHVLVRDEVQRAYR